tara:strand:+ start:118 stop:510 length:393 start_codon:yes stop_codon:yes gene_type:complete
MLQNYLYFSTGDGVNATAEVACIPCSKIRGVFPDGNVSGVKTTIAYEGTTNDTASGTHVGEFVAVTHSNNSGSTGHDARNIARAVSEACNSGPHTNGPITIIDLDNNIYYDSLNYLRNDSNLDLQIQLDT